MASAGRFENRSDDLRVAVLSCMNAATRRQQTASEPTRRRRSKKGRTCNVQCAATVSEANHQIGLMPARPRTRHQQQHRPRNQHQEPPNQLESMTNQGMWAESTRKPEWHLRTSRASSTEFMNAAMISSERPHASRVFTCNSKTRKEKRVNSAAGRIIGGAFSEDSGSLERDWMFTTSAPPASSVSTAQSQHKPIHQPPQLEHKNQPSA